SQEIDELPHHAPIEITPTDPGRKPLKNVPFEIRQLHEPSPEPALAGAPPPKPKEPERRPLAWHVVAAGLFGHAAVGFRVEPEASFVDVTTLEPGASGVTLAIPIDVQLMADGRPLGNDRSALAVGSKVTFRVDSRPRSGESSELIGMEVRL